MESHSIHFTTVNSHQSFNPLRKSLATKSMNHQHQNSKKQPIFTMKKITQDHPEENMKSPETDSKSKIPSLPFTPENKLLNHAHSNRGKPIASPSPAKIWSSSSNINLQKSKSTKTAIAPDSSNLSLAKIHVAKYHTQDGDENFGGLGSKDCFSNFSHPKFTMNQFIQDSIVEEVTIKSGDGVNLSPVQQSYFTKKSVAQERNSENDIEEYLQQKIEQNIRGLTVQSRQRSESKSTPIVFERFKSSSEIRSVDLRSKFFARTKVKINEGPTNDEASSNDYQTGKQNAISSFNLEEFLLNRNSEIIHTHLKGCNKILVSSRGTQIYFGGEGLHCLELINGEYKLTRKDSHSRKKLSKKLIFKA